MASIVFFGNNHLSVRVAEWLKQQDDPIVGAVIHPPARQQWTRELVETLALPSECVYDAADLAKAQTSLGELAPEFGISVLFGFILPPEILALFPRGVINLHLALLPYGRGAHPNVWSIVERTPAGVTLHYMDQGIDIGDILAQQEVIVERFDTGKTLYHKLEDAAFALFRSTWPGIVEGSVAARPQEPGGSFHRTRELERLAEIDLDRTYSARELIDLLRAQTFPPFRGAYFRTGDKRVYLQLQLEEEPS